MSSIARSFGVETPYNELSYLSSTDISRYDNVVNFIIDGLGYNYMTSKGEGSLLCNNIIGRMTSVFPSTTATAITSFATGLTAKEHGITGWFMKLDGEKESVPSVILPYVSRNDGKHLSEYGISAKKVIPANVLTEQLKKTYVIIPDLMKNSTYTQKFLKGAERFGYNDTETFFNTTINLCKQKTTHKKYIYSYFPAFDELFHRFGSEHDGLFRLYKQLDSYFEEFLKHLNGTNSLVIVTADHGLMDTPKDRNINLNNYPEITKMLSFPLCGEPRVAYAYVKDEYKDNFISIAEKELSCCCDIYKAADLVNTGVFGLYDEHRYFRDRIGDFILIAKEDYVIRDFLPDECVDFLKGNHGGLSDDELFTPLTVFEKK